MVFDPQRHDEGALQGFIAAFDAGSLGDASETGQAAWRPEPL